MNSSGSSTAYIDGVATTELVREDRPVPDGGGEQHPERIDRVWSVANWFVAAGRVVPGLVFTESGARSQWWPLPSANDRDLLRSLLPGPSATDHAWAADALADAVDKLMRSRVAGVSTTKSKRGKRSVAEAWVVSLNSADPTLPKTLNTHEVQEFSEKVAAWVRGAAATQTRTRVVLRIEEPISTTSSTPDPPTQRSDGLWSVRVLAQDADEPTLVVPASDLWDGLAFSPSAVAELLEALGRVVRIAPELSSLLASSRPADVLLATEDLVQFVRERVGPLVEAGVGVALPSWWSSRHRVKLRAKAKSKRSSGGTSGTAAGFGFDQLVSFTWEAALGGRRLTKAELEELEAAAASKQSLVRVRGEWVELDADELAAVISAVGQAGSATTSELVRSAMGLGGIALPVGVSDTGSLEVSATGWVGDLLDGALHSSASPIEDPKGFIGSLRPYQKRGAGWLSFLGQLGLGACLADDMGLGKTAQVIATVLADPIDAPTLIVCPVSVLGNWQREFEKFAPTLRVKIHHGVDRLRAEDQPFADRAAADVVLTTYSIVARDTEVLSSVPWGRLVLDEAQQVKNPGTAQARAIRKIDAPRRIALTGTPVENRVSELWALMNVLNPGLLGTSSEFKRRFAVPIETNGDTAAAELLRRIAGPFMLRRLKTDRSIITDLPEKIEQTEQVPLSREQATLYQAIVNDLLERADEAEGIERRGLVLAGIAKLKQVCNHPAHFAKDGSTLHGRSGKLDRTLELLDEIVEAGDRVLCFTQFAEWGALLATHFAKRYGESPLWLHGGVARKKRDEMVEIFGQPNGPQIFLLSLKAGGSGLNLTAASHVIHLDRWWNPAVEDQATDRAFRIGQTRTVLVHKFVSAGTIEERIDSMIQSKRSLANSVVGTGEAWLSDLSTADLRDVLTLRESTIGEAE